MTQPKKTNKNKEADLRRARLGAALRANLKKRKQQARNVGRAEDAAIDAAQGDEQGHR